MKRLLALLAALALLLSCPAFASEDADAEREAAAFAAAGAAVAACTDDGMSDIEKLTALHDWLALHCDYGATLRGMTAYGALVEGTANCVGYAEGYAALARLAGLDGVSTYSESIDHAWILATLDGVRYFSDCTWDDGKRARIGLIRHEYWLFDEDDAASIGHVGWDSGETVPGGPLELAPWGAAVTRVIFHRDYAYYIDAGFTLVRCDRATWETEPLAVLSDERWDGEELCTSLIRMGGTLIYNTPREVRCVDLEGGSMRTLCAPDTSERLVYGVGVRDGRLCYTQAEEAGSIAYDLVDMGVPALWAWGY